jgi:hypothetical protein
MTAGSKPPGHRGGGTETCSFCGSFDIVRRIDIWRLCAVHEYKIMPDDAEVLKKERRERNAHIIPPPPRV